MYFISHFLEDFGDVLLFRVLETIVQMDDGLVVVERDTIGGGDD